MSRSIDARPVATVTDLAAEHDRDDRGGHAPWLVDHSHLLSRPRVGPWEHLGAGEIMALLPGLPDWQNRDELSGPEGKAARARLSSTLNGARRILDWLLTVPGHGWQERWIAAGGDDMTWIDAVDPTDTRSDRTRRQETTRALTCLILLRVVFVNYEFLHRFGSRALLARARATLRPDLFALVEQAGLDRGQSRSQLLDPMAVLSKLVLQTGRDVDQLVPGDLLALFSWGLRHPGRKPLGLHNTWELLSVVGVTKPGSTLRNAALRGQRTSEELVDDHQIQCEPIRAVLIRYLDERRPSYDYNSLRDTAGVLAGRFWTDIETYHPGIDSLQLSPDVAAGWMERMRTITDNAGNVRPRKDVLRMFTKVRAFYLDIQQWALEDASWAAWAVPSPVSRNDTKGLIKVVKRRQAQMHQRIRERLPQLPVLADSADRSRIDTGALLAIACDIDIGGVFDHGGVRYQRAAWRSSNKTRLGPADVRVTNLVTGETFNLTRREDDAFWAWAVIETLRHTGVRIEELLEITHLALVSYRLPDTGELVPLLQIVPSKSNEERLLLISPELASVLATVVTRLRTINGGSVGLVSRFDSYESVAGPPLPHLFQRSRGGRSHIISPPTVRKLIDKALAVTGLVTPAGQQMAFTPHDFRRMFVTDIVSKGLPVHIAARLLGHASLETTQAYLAVFQEDLIRSYRSFLDNRRADRPAAEYREPTELEWVEFQQHFQARKLELGDCGRPYGSPCGHEHACILCPMLRVDPRQRDRLVAIIHNLTDRISEARMNRWLGEANGLQTSLEAARDKLATVDRNAKSGGSITNLGIPVITAGSSGGSGAPKPAVG